jgi:hypothetical protein
MLPFWKRSDLHKRPLTTSNLLWMWVGWVMFTAWLVAGTLEWLALSILWLFGARENQEKD